MWGCDLSNFFIKFCRLILSFSKEDFFILGQVLCIRIKNGKKTISTKRSLYFYLQLLELYIYRKTKIFIKKIACCFVFISFYALLFWNSKNLHDIWNKWSLQNGEDLDTFKATLPFPTSPLPPPVSYTHLTLPTKRIV